MRNNGKLIAIIGVDGTGKSTLQDSLVSYLSDLNFKVILMHKGFGILNNLSFGSGLVVAGNYFNPRVSNEKKIKQKKPFLNYLLRRLYVFLYFFEYFIGNIYLFWLINILGKIVVFDRYYFDVFTKPYTRDFIKPNFFSDRFYRKPNLLILLYGNSNEIYLRKREITIEEVEIQTNAFFNSSMGIKNRIVINTSIISASDTAKTVIEALS